MQTHMRLNSLFAQLLFDKKPDFLRADLGGKRYQRILEVLDNTIHYDNRLLKLSFICLFIDLFQINKTNQKALRSVAEFSVMMRKKK